MAKASPSLGRDILRKLQVAALEDLSMARANKLIDRLQELATQPADVTRSPA
jgi:hypothetical protein